MEGFVTEKRSADGGIDGRIYFELAEMKDLQSMVVEVKGGKNVNIQSLRALRGVLDSEDAMVAGLIIMQPLGKIQERNFRKFMADAGDLVVNRRPYPRMQLLSVPDILKGNIFDMPNIAGRHELQPSLMAVKFAGLGRSWQCSRCVAKRRNDRWNTRYDSLLLWRIKRV